MAKLEVCYTCNMAFDREHGTSRDHYGNSGKPEKKWYCPSHQPRWERTENFRYYREVQCGADGTLILERSELRAALKAMKQRVRDRQAYNMFTYVDISGRRHG